MFDINALTRWVATRRGTAAGVSILALVASIAAIYATFFRPAQTSLRLPPNVLWPLVVKPEMETTDLAIIAADMKDERFGWPFSFFSTIRQVYRYNISIKNGDGAARQACSIDSEHRGPSTGLVRGGAILNVGRGPVWYSDDEYFMFDLPKDPTFDQAFYFNPRAPMYVELDWARVRVICRLPNPQMSSWYNVDFGRIDQK
jgi:hypothetical protein